MYDNKIKRSIIDSLESKVIDVADISIALASQGYFINRNKQVKLNWSIILLHALDNIDILNNKQQHNIELLCNKILTT